MEPFAIIESIEQLTHAVHKVFIETESRWWLRGQTDQSWDLLPGIRRKHSKQVEKYMTNLFYDRARTRYPNCPPNVDYGGWLALMQHYGLPTRLLDWTWSPLVATYFATKYSIDLNKKDELTDAAIWMLHPTRLNKTQGYDAVFPPLDAKSLVPLVKPAIKGTDTSKFKVLAASPLETDLKMLTQQGTFTVHVTGQPLNKVAGCGAWLKKMVIPKKAIRPIAMELDVLGIRLADLFTDLHHLAKEIFKTFETP